MTDIADVNWSERDDRNAEVAPFGFPPGLPAQIELIGRMMMGAIKRSWNKNNPVYPTTGTGDDYVATPESQTVFINLYEIVRVRIDRTNTTTTPSLKFGQTNARTIVKISTTGIAPLIAGDLLEGKDHSFWYNGTSYVLADPATVDSSVTVGLLKTANNLSELTPTASIARTNIGLGNVDDTSDVDKPVSTAQASAINAALTAAESYADAGLATKLSLSGGTMTGPVNFGYQTISNPGGLLLQGFLYGLTLSNNVSDATNDIDIAVGSAASDAATPTLMTLASSLTKRLDAAWAVGTNQGGLDTGSIANTTYHVFLIQRSDTGVVDALFSTSATSPTMPTSYDRKRRIGSIIRSGATILAFRQFNNRFMLSTVVQARSSTAAFADALLTVTAPAGIRTRPILTNVLSLSASSSAQMSFGDGDGSAVQFVGQTCGGGNNDTVVIDQVYTNTSSQIRYLAQINSGTITGNTLNSAGWWDTRDING
ncbi:MAG TPA: hypothetical protein VJ846_07065 [Sphingomicrobium sp.]|nr:hypothetical protein [Sphingomicrobium sp.]